MLLFEQEVAEESEWKGNVAKATRVQRSPRVSENGNVRCLRDFDFGYVDRRRCERATRQRRNRETLRPSAPMLLLEQEVAEESEWKGNVAEAARVPKSPRVSENTDLQSLRDFGCLMCHLIEL